MIKESPQPPDENQTPKEDMRLIGYWQFIQANIEASENRREEHFVKLKGLPEDSETRRGHEAAIIGYNAAIDTLANLSNKFLDSFPALERQLKRAAKSFRQS